MKTFEVYIMCHNIKSNVWTTHVQDKNRWQKRQKGLCYLAEMYQVTVNYSHKAQIIVICWVVPITSWSE